MRRAATVAGVLAGVGLMGPWLDPVSAQTRVVVPIVIQAPRPALPTASTPASSVLVTTRTQSVQPGVTTTRVTVRDTSGAGRNLSVAPTARTLATVPAGPPSVLVTVDGPVGVDGTGASGRTRVTVEDVSSMGRLAGGGPVPASSLRAAHPTGQTWTITSEAPIDTPIVILGH